MSRSNTTLEDIFEILEVDPDGKKFDKGCLFIFSLHFYCCCCTCSISNALFLNAFMVIFALQLVVLRPEATYMNWIWCWM